MPPDLHKPFQCGSEDAVAVHSLDRLLARNQGSRKPRLLEHAGLRVSQDEDHLAAPTPSPRSGRERHARLEPCEATIALASDKPRAARSHPYSPRDSSRWPRVCQPPSNKCSPTTRIEYFMFRGKRSVSTLSGRLLAQLELRAQQGRRPPGASVTWTRKTKGRRKNW
jgi:hypothetical protein